MYVTDNYPIDHFHMVYGRPPFCTFACTPPSNITERLQRPFKLYTINRHKSTPRDTIVLHQELPFK